MKIITTKNLKTKFILMILGLGYFTFFSSLDISPFLKGYVTIIPLQLLTLAFFFYRFYLHKQSR
ncbi:MAG: hypothetical protein IGQ45_03060 [Cyanobacterium sp. T60_A2020_053]|nr:hypothetical protein [Cyanobacterium sp. T60_A2020_053]